MNARKVYESMGFKRGEDPYSALDVGYPREAYLDDDNAEDFIEQKISQDLKDIGPFDFLSDEYIFDFNFFHNDKPYGAAWQFCPGPDPDSYGELTIYEFSDDDFDRSRRTYIYNEVYSLKMLIHLIKEFVNKL